MQASAIRNFWFKIKAPLCAINPLKVSAGWIASKHVKFVPKVTYPVVQKTNCWFHFESYFCDFFLKTWKSPFSYIIYQSADRHLAIKHHHIRTEWTHRRLSKCVRALLHTQQISEGTHPTDNDAAGFQWPISTYRHLTETSSGRGTNAPWMPKD